MVAVAGTQKMQKLVVIGQGYVGLPLSMQAVKAGYQVVGLEVDEARAKRLQTGDSYVEDISSDELAAAQDHACDGIERVAVGHMRIAGGGGA